MYLTIKRTNFDKKINQKVFHKKINKNAFKIILSNKLSERTFYKKQLFKEKTKITLMPEYCSTCLWKNNSEIEIFDLPKITHQLYNKLKKFSDDFELLMKDQLDFEYTPTDEERKKFYSSKEMENFISLGYEICYKLKKILNSDYYDVYFYDIKKFYFSDNKEPNIKI